MLDIIAYSMDKEKLQTFFFIGVLVGMLLLMAMILLPYLAVFVVAGTLAVMFEPLYRRLRTVLQNDSVASLATVLFVFVIICIPIVYFGMHIARDVNQMYYSVAAGQGNILLDQVTQSLGINVQFDFDQLLQQALGWIINHAVSVFSSVAQILFAFLLSMLALFYFLKDGKKFLDLFTLLSPLPDTDDEEIYKRLGKAIHSVVFGYLGIALMQGILVSIGFYIFGIPNSALWGALAAIVEPIPFIRSVFIVLTACIYLFSTGHAAAAIGLLAWDIIVGGSIDNFVAPKLIERGLKIHPLFILFSLLGGLAVFGPIGFLMGPIILSLFFALLDIYKKRFDIGHV